MMMMMMRFVHVAALLLWLFPSASIAAPVRRPTVRRPTVKPVRRPTTKPVAAPVPVLSPVAKKIAQYAPGNYNAFVPGSYQAKALVFVQSIPNANSLLASKAVQYYALACLYYATYARSNAATQANAPGQVVKGWISSKNWLNKTVDCCSGWQGVLCANKKVTVIDLHDNRLTGFVPYEITLLSANNPSGAGNLIQLNFNGNDLLFNNGDAGELNWIGGLGSNMQYLYLRSTSMYSSKGVPDTLGKLSNLFEFVCSTSLIMGPLRSTPFATLNKLQYLEIDSNAYNSSIPTVIGTLPNLLYFYAGDSYIGGDLSFMKGMKSALEVWVDRNNIRGSLPTYLGSITTLQSFSVSRNALTGSFPSQMAKLVSMKQMWYYSNKLSGAFPNSFKAMKFLKVFHLESNNVQGDATTFCNELEPPFGPLNNPGGLGVDCTKVICPSSCKCCCSLSACVDTA